MKHKYNVIACVLVIVLLFATVTGCTSNDQEKLVPDETSTVESTSTPTETSKPEETSTPVETSKPSETSKPAETSEPTETSTETPTETKPDEKPVVENDDLVWTVTRKATCAQEGEESATNSAGEKLTRAIPKLEHKYKDTVVKPTADSDGYTEHRCTVCGHSFKDNYTGSIETWGNWTKHSEDEIKAATCAATGTKRITYTRTSNKGNVDTKTEEATIPKLTTHVGGTTLKNAKAATTTAEGYTGDKVCNTCGKTIEQGKQIPKISASHTHTWVDNYKTVHHPAEYKTVHHDAEYKTVHHDAEYKTVHHEAEYKTVHHDAEYKTVHHEAEYKTVHHDAEYKTVHHEAEYKTVHHEAEVIHHPGYWGERKVTEWHSHKIWWINHTRLASMTAPGASNPENVIYEEWYGHIEGDEQRYKAAFDKYSDDNTLLNWGMSQGSHPVEVTITDWIDAWDEVIKEAWDEEVLVKEAWDEKVLVKAAWDEKVLVKAAYDEKVLVKAAYDEKVLVKAAYDEKVLVKAAWDEKVKIKDAWDEKVLVKAAYDERVKDGQICSGCGKTK